VNDPGEQRRQWAETAAKRVSPARLRDLARGLVDIASPTGDEAPLAEHITSTLRAAGLTAATQPIDDRQANSWGRVPGSGTGPDLKLYAPIDTLTTGDPDQDMPWIGPRWRPDMAAESSVDGDLVIGLGASNPKGHAACVLAAAEAIREADLPLTGDLVVAFGAGGMPTNSLPGSARRNTGQGAGCSFLLEQGVWADYALIAKPGWSVSWEEVGLAWFEVTVHGTHTYVGSRHRLPYRNAVADAGRVAERLSAGESGTPDGPQSVDVPLAGHLVDSLAIRGARLEVFTECGHWPQHEQAERYNELSLAFLAGAAREP
jgi:acetylornithine deacetylase/succinyl-diaminopimelate desuccinylase-like protein